MQILSAFADNKSSCIIDVIAGIFLAPEYSNSIYFFINALHLSIFILPRVLLFIIEPLNFFNASSVDLITKELNSGVLGFGIFDKVITSCESTNPSSTILGEGAFAHCKVASHDVSVLLPSIFPSRKYSNPLCFEMPSSDISLSVPPVCFFDLLFGFFWFLFFDFFEFLYFFPPTLRICAFFGGVGARTFPMFWCILSHHSE